MNNIRHRGPKCCIECGITCGITIPLSRRVISASTRVFDALWRASFIMRDSERTRAGKIRSHQARNRSGPRKGQGWGLPFIRPFRLRPIKLQKINEGSGTPANAGYHRRILRCGARPFGARTLDGVPPRLSPKGIIPSQRLSFRPGFLGRGLHGRYPPSPVPVQGCTSHPGRNAGRHDAQAARERTANPPAGTALAPMTRCASAPCPSLERDCEVTGMETDVKWRR